MFEDIGKKIMTLAKVLAVLDIIGAVILAIVYGSNAGFLGFIIAAVAGFMAVVSCWPLYGFGQLVDDIHSGREIQKNEKVWENEDIPEL